MRWLVSEQVAAHTTWMYETTLSTVCSVPQQICPLGQSAGLAHRTGVPAHDEPPVWQLSV
jgi:hypothetical protein